MANNPAAKKRVRQITKKTERNNAARSRVRTFVRKAEESIAEGKRPDAEQAFQKAMSELHRGVNKGVVKKNTASRKISRLNNALRAVK